MLFTAVLAVAASGGLERAAAQQPAESLTADQVQNAIRRGCDYLLGEQNQRGGWDEMMQYPGGVTALCTLALLNSGVEPSNPKIQKALDYLRAIEPTKVYSVSLQTMALCEGEPRRDLALIQRNAAWLERVQIKDGDRAGSWSYDDKLGGDNSNSQFAVLALHEAERVGAKIDPETWRRAADYWKRVQNPDGSWSYQPGLPGGTGSMTCAGVGAWVICSARTSKPAAKIEGEAMQCCLPPEDDDVLERAIVWMGRNFSVQRNPGSGGGLWHLYYLYGLERFGRLTAQRFISDHDWYREGAEYLVRSQDQFSHYWQGRGHAEDSPPIATSLALLFLSKGRRPVLIANVKHGPELDWNNHPMALANLTAFTESQWGLDLTWQVIDPEQASVDDLLQAPVLFLSGSKKPDLTGLETKVRDYLDRGGFLFAEACCANSRGFDAEMRLFLDRVFPEGEYALQRAGPEHAIWKIDKLVRPDSPYVGRLWTVEYGCRTCVAFSEVDLSCSWELATRADLAAAPAEAKARIDDALALGLNVLAYATNREPKGKEQSFESLDAEQLDALGARGVIRVAKLMHGGGCNDAPGALANLLRAASQGELKLEVSTSQFNLRANDPGLLRFHMAFMHGRHDFRFTPEEQENLRRFLENGGMLFADSICASKEFTAAFRRELAAVLPQQRLARIPATHRLFTSAAGGFDLQTVHRREPAVAQPGQPLRARVVETPPELEGVELDGRLAVIFSPYDVSCALEQHEALQCRGYTREDAARIGLNVLMYSLSPDAAEPTAAE
jgi:hypothetical protein